MTLLTNLTTSQLLPGYELTKTIYQGARTKVCRAVDIATQKPVVVKVLSQEYHSFSNLVEFRNQYTITKNLAIAGIVRPLAIKPYGNSFALIMEDFGGLDLGQYIQQRALGLTDVLDIALQLVQILHELHQQGVIHKDLKPSNILIHPDSKQVKLIDFSIASLLPKETQAIHSPKSLEGTLAYLAPEQTGRMNRAIDYRTDYYALGVTLYQLLTGQLPFAEDDPLKLIHCHMAHRPIAIEQLNPEVPSVVAAIVGKLMAKNAEDRYQSTLGLKHDLEHCLHQWQKHGAITDLVLGQRDLSDRFTIPEKLYGRENEVQALLKAFDRVAQGAAELVLVAGFSGIGKTAVVNEIHKPIVRQRGYFAKGKFDQFNRDIPFFAFVQAFRDLVGQLLSESDAQLAAWKTQLLAAVGENGQVLIEVIPELQLIIGPQPPVAELSGAAAQNRFNRLFQAFIQVFTTSEHPLVLFLDDLQWADAASLQLLKLLTKGNAYLLLLGAYRDNEVSPVHPFILTVDELIKTEFCVNTLTLKPLPFESTNQLIADTLTCSRSVAHPLTELVDLKTQGNPFFITQFLTALHKERQITFNSDCGYWECDISQIKALSLTDNVVEFMTQQLQKLAPATQTTLALAACIGNKFDLTTLAIVTEQSTTEAAVTLWQSLQEGLVVPITQSYKFFQAEDPVEFKSDINPSYRFLHDRVQQAAYGLITEAQKSPTHLRIGQLLQQNLSETAQDEKLFDIVGHLNLAKALITATQDRENLAQLNLAAGQKAKKATAYAASKRYFQTGIELLLTDCWQQQYEIALSLHVAAAEAAYLNGAFDEIEVWSNQVLNSARTSLDKVKIYEVQISACTAQSQMLAAIDIRPVVN